MTGPFEPPAPGPAPYGQPPSPYGQPPSPYGNPPGYGHPPYGAPMRNGLGTAALVLGIIGVVSGARMFFVAFVLGILAVVFGLVGRGRAKRGEASNKTAATWGFALGVVAILASIAGRSS